MSLEEMNKRLQYRGGNQEQRFINDKLKGLKKALLYSYQAATAILSDQREFRCLINPDKNKPAYDNKIISIPYKDICLNAERVGITTQGEVTIGMKTGDVFTWKETDTHWLVYLEYLEEDAYFRAEIRRCDQQVQINGSKYWVYLRGPTETSIEWNQKSQIEWNTLNYSLVMYISADSTTKDYFYRFKTIKIKDPRDETDKTWQVVGVDPYYGDGIIQVFLDEYFNNSIQDAAVAAQTPTQSSQTTPVDQNEPRIDGPRRVSQYGRYIFTPINVTGGSWYILWHGEEINLNSSSAALSLDIPGQLTTFILIYRRDGETDITLSVQIVSL